MILGSRKVAFADRKAAAVRRIGLTDWFNR